MALWKWRKKQRRTTTHTHTHHHHHHPHHHHHHCTSACTVLVKALFDFPGGLAPLRVRFRFRVSVSWVRFVFSIFEYFHDIRSPSFKLIDCLWFVIFHKFLFSLIFRNIFWNVRNRESRWHGCSSDYWENSATDENNQWNNHQTAWFSQGFWYFICLTVLPHIMQHKVLSFLLDLWYFGSELLFRIMIREFGRPNSYFGSVFFIRSPNSLFGSEARDSPRGLEAQILPWFT